MSHPATPHDIFATLRDLNQIDEEDRRSPGGPEEPRRRTLFERLPLEIARQYLRLLQAGRRPAVITTIRGYCQACHMLVPPQLMLLLTRAELICRCPSCHRFLCPSTPDQTEQDPHA